MRWSWMWLGAVGLLCMSCHEAILLSDQQKADQEAKRRDEEANREIAASTADTERDVVKLRCPNGADLAPGCGFVLAHVASQSFRDTFRDKKCSGKSVEMCQLTFERDVDTTLRERYWAADRATVAKRCDAEAPRCDDPLTFEKDLLTSHNMRVQIEGANRKMAIESARNAQRTTEQSEQQLRTDLLFFGTDAPRCRTHVSLTGGGIVRVCN